MAEIRLKRERNPNYSDEETRLLVDLVLQHSNVIENKVSDAFTWKEKNQAWDTVASSFNARSSAMVQRDSANLKAKYESLKKTLKKKVAKEKCDIYITGGGSKVVVNYKDCEEKLLAILKLAICGLSTVHDSDGLPEASPTTVVLPVSSPQEESPRTVVLPVSSPQEESPRTVVLPVPASPTMQPSTSTSETIQILFAENLQVDPEEVPIAYSINDSEETASAINSTTTKWDSWTPASLRKRKSSALRKQPRQELSKKEAINVKYDALADERKKLIAVQMEVAKKELEVLRAREAREEELMALQKHQIERKMEQDEEEHKLKMELLKQQLNRIK